MNLYEYEGKSLLRRHGMAVPEEYLARTAEEAREKAEAMGFPVVIKAQILKGGRGKAGGIHSAATSQEAFMAASALLNKPLLGELCTSVLVARRVDISDEWYVAFAVDEQNATAVLLFSTHGGVDIEQAARAEASAMGRLAFIPGGRLPPHRLRHCLEEAGLPSACLTEVTRCLCALHTAYIAEKALVLEINPLVCTKDGKLMALDAKIVLDDALYKSGLTPPVRPAATDPSALLQQRAKAIGVNHVQLEGEVAVIAGGAGLAMATMDAACQAGYRVGSFLDTGGGISRDNMAEAVKISLAVPGIRALVVNMFGGINDCAEVAEGLVRAMRETAFIGALAVKMRGHSQHEAWALLEQHHVALVKDGTTEELIRQMGSQGGQHGHFA